MRLGRTNLLSKIVILVLVLHGGISLISLRQQVSEARGRRDDLQTEIGSVIEENSNLQFAIDNSTDSEIIEDIARNRIGLVRPDEKIFFDVSN